LATLWLGACVVLGGDESLLKEAREELGKALDEAVDDSRKVSIFIDKEEGRGEPYLATFDVNPVDHNALWGNQPNVQDIIDELQLQEKASKNNQRFPQLKEKMLNEHPTLKGMSPDARKKFFEENSRKKTNGGDMFNLLNKLPKSAKMQEQLGNNPEGNVIPPATPASPLSDSETQSASDSPSPSNPTENNDIARVSTAASPALSNISPASPSPAPGSSFPVQQISASNPLGCVMWRQTGNCDPFKGTREPQYDQACSRTIASSWSGYCECEEITPNETTKIVKRAQVDCQHASLSCDDICRNGDAHLHSSKGMQLARLDSLSNIQAAFRESKVWIPLSPANAHELVHHVAKPFVMLLLCDCERDALFSAILPEIDQVLLAKPNFNEFKFLTQSTTISTSFGTVPRYGLKSSDLPILVTDNIPFGPTIEKTVFPAHLLITPQNIADYADEVFVRRSIPLKIQSRIPPPDGTKERDVLVVTASTYNDLVIRSDATVLLFVYGPNCPASQAVLPLLEQLARRLASSENPEERAVVVAKFDHTANDLPHGGIALRHYPTPLLFPRDNKPAGVLSFDDFNGSKLPHDKSVPHSHYDLETFMDFVVSHRDKDRIAHGDHHGHDHHRPE